MEIKVKLKVPPMPEFLEVEGMVEGKFLVRELSNKDANEMAEEIRKAFIKHWDDLNRQH